jgi:ubiquinone/menaquinone biosynthesis C-methylase UbiE
MPRTVQADLPTWDLAEREIGEVGLGKPIVFGGSGVAKRLGAFDRIAPFCGERLLDVGCGNGAYTLELASQFGHVDAIDVERENLQELERHLAEESRSGTVETHRMSAETIGFVDETFDAVTAIEVLEHILDLPAAMREISRVLKPGGLLYVSVPNRLFPLETHTVVLPGRHEFAGRLLPFLPYVKPLHQRISKARNFTDAELVKAASGVGLITVGLDHVMPPFDHWRFGRRWIKPLTERVERSAFGRFGVSIIGVFQRRAAAIEEGFVGPAGQGLVSR